MNDCQPGVCAPSASCVDLTNDFYCRCPFNLTGEDCRKNINIDYDLSFTDPEKSTSASLVVPFVLNSGAKEELSVAMWVQIETRGETGTYFTLYSVDHPDKAINKRVLMQAVNSGVFVNLFGPEVPSVYLQVRNTNYETTNLCLLVPFFPF